MNKDQDGHQKTLYQINTLCIMLKLTQLNTFLLASVVKENFRIVWVHYKIKIPSYHHQDKNVSQLDV